MPTGFPAAIRGRGCVPDHGQSLYLEDLYMPDFDHEHPSDRIGEPGYAREVNARMREERKLSKAQERQVRKGVGQLSAVANAATKRHHADPHAQVNFLLRRATIVAATGRKRVVSDKRKSDIGNFVHQSINELKGLRINLQNVTEFSQKHFLALMRSWEANDLRESTIQERICLLRRFFCLIGKPNAIPTGDVLCRLLQQNGIQAGTRGRTYIPDLPKGWRDLGIDVDAVIAMVASMDAIAGVLLKLMLVFGLRLNEAMQLQPSVSRHATHLFVWRGTKGGKQRSIPFSSEPEKAKREQEVLDEAVAIASRHPKGELGWKGLSLEQSKNHLRVLLRNAGITKGGLGVTPHGLRHQYATDLFEQLTGLPAPVLQKLPYEAYLREKVKVAAAFLEISRRMGHERPNITQSYGGSVARLQRGDLGRGRPDDAAEILQPN